MVSLFQRGAEPALSESVTRMVVRSTGWFASILNIGGEADFKLLDHFHELAMRSFLFPLRLLHECK